MKKILLSFTMSAACSLLLTACPTVPMKAPPTPEESAQQSANVAAEQAKASKETELEQALALYTDGQFGRAAVALRPLIDAPELPQASRLRAIKFTALSFCIQGQTSECRQFFEQALRVDANIQLADTEASHPIWGAEFRKAQRNVRLNPAPLRTPEKPSH